MKVSLKDAPHNLEVGIVVHFDPELVVGLLREEVDSDVLDVLQKLIWLRYESEVRSHEV